MLFKWKTMWWELKERKHYEGDKMVEKCRRERKLKQLKLGLQKKKQAEGTGHPPSRNTCAGLSFKKRFQVVILFVVTNKDCRSHIAFFNPACICYV